MNKDKYIISRELQYALAQEKFYENKDNNIVESPYNMEYNVYLVMFRVLNKENKSFVYNYIHYTHIFAYTLLHYLFTRNKVLGNIYKEPGFFLTILDNYFIGNYEGNRDECIVDKLHINKFFIDIDKLLFDIINDQPLYLTVTATETFKLINKLIYTTDYNNMGYLFKLAQERKNMLFINEIFKSVNNYQSLVDKLTEEQENPSISIINSCLFVVEDLDKLIKTIKDNNNINVNAGPQPLRGQVNSINSFLSLLDLDYRNSLYNHNNYHSSSGYTHSNLKLDRNKFSFNNVHMNLGRTRWYSTTTNTKSNLVFTKPLLSKNLASNINKFYIVMNLGVRWSSTFHSERVKSRDDLLQTCFKEIDDILKKKNHIALDVLQREIEDLLFEGQTWYSESNKPKNKILYNSTTHDFITNSKQTVDELLRYPDKFSGNTKTHGTEYIPWFKKILKQLGHNRVSDMLIQYFLYVVTNESITVEDIETPGIPSLVCYNNFGKRVVNLYFYYRFLESSKETFSEFKDNDSEYKKTLEDSNFNARVGGFFIYALIESKLIKLSLDSKSGEYYKYQEYIRLTRNSRKFMRADKDQIVFHLPSKLPMICPPKEYYKGKNDVKLGGYLLNDVKYVEGIFIKKEGYGKPTGLKDKNIIVDLINGLSRTPYKVNTDTLNFIYKYGVEKGIIINTELEDIKNILNNPYKSTNKREGRQHRSLVSRIKLEKNVLSIAELYSDLEIFFPVRMDNRTRNYCITDYFDYQKNDLAKGLISFSKPGMWYKTDTDVIKYFKGFGANMFGDNLDKKSLNHRVNWVEENSERILNFENNDIVNKAENKTCFVSFCFEYKRFVEYMSNHESNVFYSYLPIQLDATCNGYQHLSLLTREKNLFDVLNLASSTHDDDPDDFYTYILNLTIVFMEHEKNTLSAIENKSNAQLKQIQSYIKLLKVVFDRSMVKKTIMTKSYNASIPTQVSQLIMNLDEKFEGKTKYYIYKDNQDVRFIRDDIVVFVMAIKSVIAKQSPRITELSKYIDAIVSICTGLNIPVPWNLPSGAEIMESYEVGKSKPIKAFFFVNTRYTFKSYQRDLYDLTQQKRATMPNLIHSLDATTIAILYSNFKNVGPLYTVHDCFGVTANNVPRLILKLKLVYIQLYSSTGYLRKFDTFVKTTINETCGDDIYKIGEDFVNIPSKNYKIASYYGDIPLPSKNYKKVPMPNINSILDKSIDVDCVKKSANIIV